MVEAWSRTEDEDWCVKGDEENAEPRDEERLVNPEAPTEDGDWSSFIGESKLQFCRALSEFVKSLLGILFDSCGIDELEFIKLRVRIEIKESIRDIFIFWNLLEVSY